jgi:hypothetical protein
VRLVVDKANLGRGQRQPGAVPEPPLVQGQGPGQGPGPGWRRTAVAPPAAPAVCAFERSFAGGPYGVSTAWQTACSSEVSAYWQLLTGGPGPDAERAFADERGLWRADIPALRERHPGLLDFRTWLGNGGTEQIRALLT